MTTFEEMAADLRGRWRPSAEQIADADARYADEVAVYTAHVLIGKEYGCWDLDVEVLPVEGTFLDREDAAYAARKKAQSIWSLTGVKTVGGYARHTGDGQWAVWEDILARFPLAKGG